MKINITDFTSSYKIWFLIIRRLDFRFNQILTNYPSVNHFKRIDYLSGMLALFTYTVFGFDIPTDVIIAILVVNTILLVVAVVGFTNLRLQIRDLKSLINRIKAKQKELRE